MEHIQEMVAALERLIYCNRIGIDNDWETICILMEKYIENNCQDPIVIDRETNEGKGMEHIWDIYFVLTRLLCYNRGETDNEWKTICTLMEQYIEKHCQHDIIDDVIDISPDASQTIRYCKYCEKTFP